MSTEANPMWVVSYIKWTIRRNGIPKICYTYGRAFRSERLARKRYNEIYKSLSESGYLLVESEAECEGVRGRLYNPKEGRNSCMNVVLYIDRNPVVW